MTAAYENNQLKHFSIGPFFREVDNIYFEDC